MEETVSTDQVVSFLRATPQQRAAFDRFLRATPEQQAAFERIFNLGNTEAGNGKATALTAVPGAVAATVVKAVEAAMERFERKLDAVARGNWELQKENEELRELQKGGFFKFALRVDPWDFRAFAVVMALGNRKAAADFLKMPHRSFYDRVEKWTARNKDYQRMYRFVEWRKKVGRKITVRLEDSVQSGEPNDMPENPVTVGAVLDEIAAADNRDYPTILRVIWQTLATQNPQNWAGVRQEVVDMIREEVCG